MVRPLVCALSVVSALLAPAARADDFPIEPGEELSGGDTTVFATGRNAFSMPLANISRQHRREHVVGNSFFNQNWVEAPSSTAGRDGLGPLFQARSCSGCHFKDGRGTPPEPGEPMVSMLVRLSVPGRDARAGVVSHEIYGDQLNERALPGITPEGRTKIRYEQVAGSYPDGTAYRLRRPTYQLEFAYGSPGDDLLMSPRVAQAVTGLGLLEAVPESAILALADPADSDADGISGRPNRVWDIATNTTVLGRFGWKSGQPSLLQQTASAFRGDIGITSDLCREENTTAGQLAAMEASDVPPAALTSEDPEIGEKTLDRVTTYLRTLAPPARRNHADPEVLRGKALFASLNCTACHTPTLRTAADAALPELADQTIHPYTDLLLHDMGADLADGRPEFEADGREWRTAPLWGIGLVEAVNGHTHFLHDGRARNLEEAVLWHGGEAAESRDAFKNLPADKRSDLLKFLNSL